MQGTALSWESSAGLSSKVPLRSNKKTFNCSSSGSVRLKCLVLYLCHLASFYVKWPHKTNSKSLIEVRPHHFVAWRLSYSRWLVTLRALLISWFCENSFLNSLIRFQYCCKINKLKEDFVYMDLNEIKIVETLKTLCETKNNRKYYRETVITSVIKHFFWS